MALKGTLEDISIVELIQFPYAGRKTGRLDIAHQGKLASLYYKDGKLVHCIVDNLEGFDATVDLVGWDRGGFEFFPNMEPDRTTIEMDLHRLVMQALKTRDEKRFATERQQRRQQPPPPAPPPPSPPLKSIVDTIATPAIAEPAKPKAAPSAPPPAEISRPPEPVKAVPLEKIEVTGLEDAELERALKKIADEYQYVIYLAVLSEKGGSGGSQLVADYKKGTEDDAIFDQIRASLSALLFTYTPSRGDLKRVLIEDDLGIVMLTRLTQTASLIVVTMVGPSLGAVSVSVNKMAASLSDKVKQY